MIYFRHDRSIKAVYHFLAGEGVVTVNGETFAVTPARP